MHPPARPARIAGATLALVLLGAGVALPQTAFADPAVVPSATTVTATGAFSGTVPEGVCFVDAEVLGGAGGKAQAFANSNGAGARISGTFAVLPGQPYSGAVGGGGASVQTPGVNGGGTGGISSSNTHPGAGGGGYSELLIGSTLAILAGGGGGSSGGHTASTEGFGGTGGLPGAAGGYAPGSAGTDGRDAPTTIVVGAGEGGTETAPGAGGTHSTTPDRDGTAGSGRTGGNGGQDANADTGGGGGGGVFGGGGGASTVDEGAGGNITGGGGGGGSSYIAPSADNVVSVAGPKRPGNAQGAGDNGSVELTWVGCDYDLAITKSVSGAATTVGDTITWAVVVENRGPDAMTLGDTVTLTDTLPGAGITTITGISVSGGTNASLERGTVTCTTAVGDPMPAALDCARPFRPLGGAVQGVRGLDVGETLTVTYTQVATGAVGTTLDNTATVVDRTTGDSNDSAVASTTLIADPPIAADDSDLDNKIGTPVSLSVTANDSGTIIANSVTLYDTALNTPIGGSLVVPGEGAWAVSAGVIIFTPEAGFEGDPTPVAYRVTDTNGLTDIATVTVAYVPEAADDASAGNKLGKPVTVRVLDNDGGDFDATSVRLIDASGNPATELVVAGEGTWRVNAATGEVTFTPDTGFFGNPTAVDYQATDTTGDTVAAKIVISYLPDASNDASNANKIGAAVTIDVIGNDSGAFDPSTVVIIDPVSGARVSSLVVDGEGTWTVDPTTGAITFTPLAVFTGNPTPVTYEVDDLGGNTTSAVVTITYLAPVPAAPAVPGTSAAPTPGTPALTRAAGPAIDASAKLAFTGADAQPLLLTGGLLLLGGVAFLLIVRRKQARRP